MVLTTYCKHHSKKECNFISIDCHEKIVSYSHRLDRAFGILVVRQGDRNGCKGEAASCGIMHHQ